MTEAVVKQSVAVAVKHQQLAGGGASGRNLVGREALVPGELAVEEFGEELVVGPVVENRQGQQQTLTQEVACGRKTHPQGLEGLVQTAGHGLGAI